MRSMETRTLIYQSGYQGALLRRNYMSAVFGWMALGLAITGGIASWILSVPLILDVMLNNRELFIALFVIELFLVFGMTLWIKKMSVSGTVFTFLSYALLNGITWTALFFLFTGKSVAIMFYVCAVTFALTGLYGFLTSKDMARSGNVWRLILVGILVTLFLNYFMRNESLYWIVSFAGVLFFTCLTVSDTRLIRMMSERAAIDHQPCLKSGGQGALMLYLNFMNLILFFLRILGGRRQGL